MEEMKKCWNFKTTQLLHLKGADEQLYALNTFKHIPVNTFMKWILCALSFCLPNK